MVLFRVPYQLHHLQTVDLQPAQIQIPEPDEPFSRSLPVACSKTLRSWFAHAR